MQVLLFRFNKTEYPLFYLQYLLKDAFKNIKKKTKKIEIILKELNERLYKELPTEVTCRIIFLDINEIKKELSFVTIGFPYFYYLSDNGGIEENEIVSFPLGVVNTNKIIIRKITLPFSQFKKIIFITDLFSTRVLKLLTVRKMNFLREKIINFGNDSKRDKEIIIIDSDFTEKNEMREIKREEYLAEDVFCESKLSVLYTAHSLYKNEDLLKSHEVLISRYLKIDNEHVLLIILKEALSNALEHGILGLEAKIKKDISGFSKYYQNKKEKLRSLESEHKMFIKLTILKLKFKRKKHLCVMIEDSGPGFDYLSKQYNHNTMAMNYLYGRGLMIIRGMATQIFFNKKANIVFIVI